MVIIIKKSINQGLRVIKVYYVILLDIIYDYLKDARKLRTFCMTIREQAQIKLESRKMMPKSSNATPVVCKANQSLG